MVKNLPANSGDIRDTSSVPGLGRSPGEGNSNHSSILAWRIHGQRNLVGYSLWGHKEMNMTEQLVLFLISMHFKDTFRFPSTLK